MTGLSPLFAPESVAVIGASQTAGKNGNTVLRNLVRGRFPGRIIPVNPSGGEVEGLPIYRSLADYGGPVDCAMVMVPAQASVEAVRECAAAGVKAVIIGASGFAEEGTEEGRRWQAELSRIAQESGMRLLGPNTNGLYNAAASLSLGYNTAHGESLPRAPISILSHSGALFGGIARCLTQYGSGLNMFLSVGNEADVSLLDALEYLVEDPATRVIGLLIEAISDGRRFRELSNAARAAGKSVVVLKIGRSRVGAAASLAHSSRLAGSARAYQALFDAAGVADVPSVEALAGACALLANASPNLPAADSGLLCITTSGGGGALLADFAGDRNMPLAGDEGGAWTGDVASLMAKLPAGGVPRNPVDVGALRDWSRLEGIFSALKQGGVNGPIAAFAHIAPRPNQDEMLADALIAWRHATGSPVAVTAPGGLRTEIEARYAAGAVPVFHELAACMDSLKAWFDLAAVAESEAGSEPGLPVSKSVPLLRPGAWPAFFDEKTSGDILREAGIPVVETRLVASAQEAFASAADLGYPVVLKALAPGVLHKNKEGHVRLAIENDAALEQALTDIRRQLGQQGHDPDTVPFILQPMKDGGLELILGVTHEPGLGHFLLIGLGGIYTEALDRSLLLAMPITRERIIRRLDQSWLSALLGSAQPRLQIADMLEALQSLVLAHHELIDSVDLNPVIVNSAGCLAVDAAIVLKPQPTSRDDK